MAKLKLEDAPPVYKCFKCNVAFDNLLEYKKHNAEIEHTHSNDSLCARCGHVRVRVESTGRVPTGDKGPKVYCKKCVKAIVSESKEGKETEEKRDG